jgi:hypothetical protein
MTQTEPQQQDVPAPDVDGDELSLSTTFELLKNRRRRETISYLLEHDGTSTLSDLAEHIAALENGIEVVELSSDQRKRVYIGLYQCHLPKLDKAGVIDFDKNRGTVVLRETVADQLVPYLQPECKTGAEPAAPAAPEPAARQMDDLWVTGAMAAGVGLLALLALVPVLGAGAVGPAAVGLLAGVGLVGGVRAFRARVDLTALFDGAEPETERETETQAD